jgi:hypothetical protein
MIFKIWAYIIATIGIAISVYLLKRNGWKLTAKITWVVCLSLAIFIGGNINIGEISASINNSFNKMREEINKTKQEINDINVKIAQAISLKQEVSQTVNLITKVEKEMVNLKETIHAQGALYKIENFTKKDIGNKVIILPNPQSPNDSSIILIELANNPEKNSIQIYKQTGNAVPPSAIDVVENIISIKASKETAYKLLGEERDMVTVKYLPNFTSSGKVKTVIGASVSENLELFAPDK